MRKLLTSSYRRLLRFSAKINAPWLAARLLRRAIVDLDPTCERGSRRYRVLCMGRSIFLDDVEALVRSDAGKEFEFLTLHKGILHEIYQAFIGSTPEGSQLNEYNYHHSDLAADGRYHYRVFLGKILDTWQSWGLRFDAFASGNFGYHQQQELIVAMSDRSIPFVCMFKEGLLIPEYLGGIAQRYIDGKVFLGQKILFYSEDIRAAVLRSDAFHGRDFSSAACGIPRLDTLVGLPPATGRQVVFFSFHPTAKFNSFVSDDSLRESAIQLGDAYHREVFQFAIDHPEWSVVIKTKAGDRFVDYISEQWQILGEPMPANVRLTSSDSATQLLRDSQAVITFMSTTSFEALLAGRRIICPDFSELFKDIAWDYFHSHPGLVNYTSNAEGIATALEAPDRTGEPGFQNARDEFLEKMVHGKDGKACERVCNEIADAITRATVVETAC